jgi:uncharacterized protein
MDAHRIIEKYYTPGSRAYHFLVEHSRMVGRKALDIAGRLGSMNVDLTFIEEASLLHDIGIFLTDSPDIGCQGPFSYVCHGYLGRELLEREGLPRHGLVCERHVGVGITLRDIEENRLPLPKREMVPVSLEERIICVADKFFSKQEGRLTAEKTPATVRAHLRCYGEEKVRKFDEWLALLSVEEVSRPLPPASYCS